MVDYDHDLSPGVTRWRHAQKHPPMPRSGHEVMPVNADADMNSTMWWMIGTRTSSGGRVNVWAGKHKGVIVVGTSDMCDKVLRKMGIDPGRA